MSDESSKLPDAEPESPSAPGTSSQSADTPAPISSHRELPVHQRLIWNAVKIQIVSLWADFRAIVAPLKKNVGQLVFFVLSIIGLWGLLEASQSTLIKIDPSLTAGPMRYTEAGTETSLTPILDQILENSAFSFAADAFPNSKLMMEEARQELANRRDYVHKRLENINAEIPFTLTLENRGQSTRITQYSVGLYLKAENHLNVTVFQQEGISIDLSLPSGDHASITGKPLIIPSLERPLWWAEYLRFLQTGPHGVSYNQDLLRVAAKTMEDVDTAVMEKYTVGVLSKKNFFLLVRAKGMRGEIITGRVNVYLPGTPITEQTSVAPDFEPVVDAAYVQLTKNFEKFAMPVVLGAEILALLLAVLRAKEGKRFHELIATFVVLAVVNTVLPVAGTVELYPLAKDFQNWFNVFKDLTSSFKTFITVGSAGQATANALVIGYLACIRWKKNNLADRVFIIYSIYIIIDFANLYFLSRAPSYYFFSNAVYDLIGAVAIVLFAPRLHQFLMWLPSAFRRKRRR